MGVPEDDALDPAERGAAFTALRILFVPASNWTTPSPSSMKYTFIAPRKSPRSSHTPSATLSNAIPRRAYRQRRGMDDRWDDLL
jgi:hypothetical protein